SRRAIGGQSGPAFHRGGDQRAQSTCRRSEAARIAGIGPAGCDLTKPRTTPVHRPMETSPDTERPLAELIAAHRPGRSLEREFYTSPRIFEHDIRRVYLRLVVCR